MTTRGIGHAGESPVRVLPLVLCLALNGCITTPHERLAPSPRSVAVDIEIARISTRGPHVLEFRMTNVSQARLLYLHWAGQGPEPVVYCRGATRQAHICSTKVYLDSDGGEWVHDIYLEPRHSVEFEANAGGAAEIGVKVFTHNPLREVIVWFANDGTAPGTLPQSGHLDR
jgi:hypothetical protein